MENTRAAIKRQSDPRWLLVVAILFGVSLLADKFIPDFEADTCSEVTCSEED